MIKFKFCINCKKKLSRSAFYSKATKCNSCVQKGKKLSQEHKNRIAKASKGRKHTNKSRKKLSETKKRSKNPNWQGGRTKDTNGYILILCNNHPDRNHDNYIFEHRLVMEKHIGRKLRAKEVVHHINGIVSDNRIENLRLFKNNSEHIKYHRNKEKLYDKIITDKGKKLLEEIK